MIRRIVFTTDFSERCRAAAVYVRSFAHRFGASVLVLHASPMIHAAYGPPEGGILPDEEATETANRQRTAELDRFIERELVGVKTQPLVIPGDPASVIAEVAASEQPDLLMMPTHGHGKFRHLLIGSVTAKVLHDVVCPVWTTAHDPAHSQPEPQIRRILCAIGDEEHAVKHMEYSARLAGAVGAELYLVHAVEYGHAYVGPEVGAVTLDPVQMSAARIEQLRTEAVAPVVSTFIRIGGAARVVRQVATETGADLVVIGRVHGGLLADLRSDTYSIIRESPAPVLSV